MIENSIEKKEIPFNKIKKNELNNRIKWIDIAKGIAIICTIIGHTVALGCNARNLIFSFHMPLFFILAGYTIKEISIHEIKEYTIKDAKRLLIPVFICVLIDSIITIFVKNCTILESLYMFFRKIIWANGNDYILVLNSKIHKFYGIGVVWFLIALFWSKLMYRIIQNKIKNNRMIFCLFISFIGIIIGKKIRLFQCIDIVFVSMIFIECGNLLKKTEKIKVNLAIHNVVIFISFVFWIYLCLEKNIYIEIAIRHYPLSMISITIALLASWCIINFSKSIENLKISNILVFIGKHSLTLLVIHFFDKYYIKLWNISNILYLNTFFRCLIDIVLLWIVIYVKMVKDKMEL